MTLRNSIKKSDIAAALGISPPALSRYIRNGCPTDSIESARDWQRRHVDPTQRRMRDREQRADDRHLILMRLGRRRMLDDIVADPSPIAAALLLLLDGCAPAEAVDAALGITKMQHDIFSHWFSTSDAQIRPLYENAGVDAPSLARLLKDVHSRKAEIADKAIAIAKCINPKFTVSDNKASARKEKAT